MELSPLALFALVHIKNDPILDNRLRTIQPMVWISRSQPSVFVFAFIMYSEYSKDQLCLV